MAKKQKCPEFENHERWLVAFADMMTLLFALFVVLYSIANVEVEKLKKVSSSIQKAFGVPSDDPKGKEGVVSKGNSRSEGIFDKVKGNTSRDSMNQRSRKEVAAIIAADTKKIEQDIEERLYGSKDFPSTKNTKSEDRIVFVNREADGIRVTLLARKFFLPNQTKLDEGAKAPLDSVATAIRGLGRQVRIEGHTDNLPYNMNGMTNWELSSARASAVVRYLIDKHQYQKESIYAAGFAETHPVASNDSPENRSLNRRVDIKILYDNPGEYVGPQDKKESGDDDSTEPKNQDE